MPLLELDAVNAYYDKIARAAETSRCEVEAGEVVALLGRNGSGRSTTCKTIMGLVQAKTGTMRFKGKEITNKSPFSLAQLGIAFVPEDRRIFPNLTVGENLRLASLAGRKGRLDREADLRLLRGARRAQGQAGQALRRRAADAGDRAGARSPTRTSSCSTSRWRAWPR